MKNILEVSNLTLAVAKRIVLSQISFNVKPKEFVVILGANGAGKSLLLKALLGFIEPAEGSIIWKSTVKIGYVPQKLSIDRSLPLTVKEFLKLKKDAISHRMIRNALNDVGLSEDIKNQPLGFLSGGQFQRVLIAWALIDKPDVFIFDEPTESIDASGETAAYELIKRMQKERGITVFLVTHDLDMVNQYADRVICLTHGHLVCAEEPKKSLSHDKLREIYGNEFHAVHH